MNNLNTPSNSANDSFDEPNYRNIVELLFTPRQESAQLSPNFEHGFYTTNAVPHSSFQVTLGIQSSQDFSQTLTQEQMTIGSFHSITDNALIDEEFTFNQVNFAYEGSIANESEAEEATTTIIQMPNEAVIDRGMVYICPGCKFHFSRSNSCLRHQSRRLRSWLIFKRRIQICIISFKQSDAKDYVGRNLDNVWVKMFIEAEKEWEILVIKVISFPNHQNILEKENVWQNMVEISGHALRDRVLFMSNTVNSLTFHPCVSTITE